MTLIIVIALTANKAFLLLIFVSFILLSMQLNPQYEHKHEVKDPNTEPFSEYPKKFVRLILLASNAQGTLVVSLRGCPAFTYHSYSI